ncbi:MAG: hypothetical protein LM572_03815 [Ignisphaera sp.]|nr:hypothetical protein [Ignisphaera sp.]MCC6056294.1 hypothetical protein [Desulfurococcaceae archaeon]
MDQILSMILILMFIVVALVASAINCIRYEGYCRRRNENLHPYNVMSTFKCAGKSCTYGVDLGNSIVFITIVEKELKPVQLNMTKSKEI